MNLISVAHSQSKIFTYRLFLDCSIVGIKSVIFMRLLCLFGVLLVFHGFVSDKIDRIGKTNMKSRMN